MSSSLLRSVEATSFYRPYQVMERANSIYTIEDLVSGKHITTHIHNLRPFNYDPDRTSPLTVAQHNEQEFVVESIINKRSTMEFKVRWAGFGKSCDTWESYKALLHMDKLDDYLRTNAMKTLIQVERTENLFKIFLGIFSQQRVFPRWFLVDETPHIFILLRLAYELRSGIVTVTLYNSRAYT